jgi:hypothetical protein
MKRETFVIDYGVTFATEALAREAERFFHEEVLPRFGGCLAFVPGEVRPTPSGERRWAANEKRERRQLRAMRRARSPQSSGGSAVSR